ncbi:MAG: itaconate CoA-transferase [Woeseiaceae bacterium]
MALPLAGQLVVALEQAVAAPLCTAKLADAGARVIKIERSEGDFARGYDDVVHGESSYFVWLNRGKESVCLDIKNSEDKGLLLRIISNADVFVQNLAPGAAQRAGFAASDLQKLNKRLITVDISGYGEDGPYRNMKAYDLLVQCESGLASITGAASEPGRVGVSICDIACGMSAHAAILEALLERQQTGLGKSLSISLFDSVADWMTVPLLHQENTGKAPSRVGISHPSIAPYGAFACSDGKQIVVAVQNSREWLAFCEHVLLQPDFGEKPDYANNVARCKNRAALDAEIGACFARLSQAEVITRLQAGGIAYGALNDLQALSVHPQLRRTTVETPGGPVELVSPPARSSGAEDSLRAVPALGEHSDAIRGEFSA